MAAKLVLDITAMQEDFFADSALIGIACSLPGYRFCGLLNKQFDLDFVRDPNQEVSLQPTPDKKYFFSVYQFLLSFSNSRHILYKLKNDTESLLPEIKRLDYLWLIQTSTAQKDAQQNIRRLRQINQVQLAQILQPEKLKNLNNLII